MDTKKLAKIIKLIIEQELKRQLPKLVKEGVQKVLNESAHVTKKQVVKEEVEQDPFSLANAMLDEDRLSSGNKESSVPVTKRKKKHFTSNSVLNDILNETTPFQGSQRINETTDTLNFGTNLAQGGTEVLNTVAAGQMGRKTAQESVGSNSKGMGVETGLPALDRILNRDNSELVKKFATRK